MRTFFALKIQLSTAKIVAPTLIKKQQKKLQYHNKPNTTLTINRLYNPILSKTNRQPSPLNKNTPSFCPHNPTARLLASDVSFRLTNPPTTASKAEVSVRHYALCPPIWLFLSFAVALSSRFMPRSMAFLPYFFFISIMASCIFRSRASHSFSASLSLSSAS